MESTSQLDLKLQGYKEEVYVHRLIVSVPRAKFNSIQHSIAPTSFGYITSDKLYTQFRFTDPRYGELLPAIKDHFFRFYLPNRYEPRLVLEENLTFPRTMIEVEQIVVDDDFYNEDTNRAWFPTPERRVIKFVGISLCFLDNQNKQLFGCQMTYDEEDGRWTCGDYWSENVSQIRISITLTNGWGSTKIPVIGSLCFVRGVPAVADMYAKYFLSHELADLEIRCAQGVKFPAHKFILGNNPVFQKMLQPQFKEGTENTIEIADISAPIMKLLLEFLYNGKVNMTDMELDMTKELLLVAEKYMADGLKIDCENALAQLVVPENIIDMFLFSDMHNAKNLKEFCKIMFKTMKSKVITDCGTFLEVSNLAPELMFAGFSD